MPSESVISCARCSAVSRLCRIEVREYFLGKILPCGCGCEYGYLRYPEEMANAKDKEYEKLIVLPWFGASSLSWVRYPGALGLNNETEAIVRSEKNVA